MQQVVQSLQQFANIKVFLRPVRNTPKTQVSHLLEQVTPMHKYPIPLDSSSNFIHQTPLFVSVRQQRARQPGRKTVSLSVKREKRQPVKKNVRAQPKIFYRTFGQMFTQNYQEPPQIAVDNLTKQHHLLRSIVKAKEENQQFNQSKNQFKASTNRIINFIAQPELYKPNKSLPYQHISRKEEFYKTFMIEKPDEIPLLNTFRHPELIKQMVKNPSLIVAPQHQEVQCNQDSNINMRKTNQFYFDHLRNVNTQRWMKKRGKMKQQKLQIKPIKEKRPDLMKLVRHQYKSTV